MPKTEKRAEKLDRIDRIRVFKLSGIKYSLKLILTKHKNIPKKIIIRRKYNQFKNIFGKNRRKNKSKVSYRN